MRVVAKGSGRKCGDGTSVGLFIPLPLHLARKFPTLIPDDHSPSHVTLLYIGEVTDPDEQVRLVEVLRKICGRWYWSDAKATLGEISSFENGERVVPHMQVEFSRDFASFRRLIKQELAQEGFKPADKFVEYQPHVTLDYLDPDEEWGGKTPKGSWTFDRIEVWGLPDVVPKIQLGKAKTAYGPTSGVQERIQGLRLRLARLQRTADAAYEVAYNLPTGADYVWRGVEKIKEMSLRWNPDKDHQTEIDVRAVNSKLDDILLDLRVLSDEVSGVRTRIHKRYHQEMYRSLSQMDDILSHLHDRGLEMTSPRSLLQRMLNHISR